MCGWPVSGVSPCKVTVTIFDTERGNRSARPSFSLSRRDARRSPALLTEHVTGQIKIRPNLQHLYPRSGRYSTRRTFMRCCSLPADEIP
jgi:hypothetical protein